MTLFLSKPRLVQFGGVLSGTASVLGPVVCGALGGRWPSQFPPYLLAIL